MLPGHSIHIVMVPILGATLLIAAGEGGGGGKRIGKKTDHVKAVKEMYSPNGTSNRASA